MFKVECSSTYMKVSLRTIAYANVQLKFVNQAYARVHISTKEYLNAHHLVLNFERLLCNQMRNGGG